VCPESRANSRGVKLAGMDLFKLPPDYPRIRRVGSFEELVSTRFEGGINALCWERTLRGDFGEVVRKLTEGEGITRIEDEQLLEMALSPAGREAVESLLADQRLLRAFDLEPELDCVWGDLRPAPSAPVATDVYSFHVDSATVEADTYLCTYHGLSSEGLRNDEAVRRVDIPQTRAELLALFGGGDGPEFREYLNDHCFDLHYAPLPNARPFVFGLGNLWRIAVDYPECSVPPCIHRAPETLPGDTPRLLLIS
jgi:hypothetical protein